jgi:hypothetical protein
VGDGADVIASSVGGQVDGKVRGRAEAGRGSRPGLVVSDPDDDDVICRERILAPTGGCQRHALAVESHGEVALARGDQASCAKPAAACEDGVGRRPKVHRRMLRQEVRHPYGYAATSRAVVGSGAISALRPHRSHDTTVSPSSVVASPAQSGQSIVNMSEDSSGVRRQESRRRS